MDNSNPRVASRLKKCRTSEVLGLYITVPGEQGKQLKMYEKWIIRRNKQKYWDI